MIRQPIRTHHNQGRGRYKPKMTWAPRKIRKLLLTVHGNHFPVWKDCLAVIATNISCYNTDDFWEQADQARVQTNLYEQTCHKVMFIVNPN